MSSGIASRPEFDSFNGRQMRQMYDWYKNGKMTVEQLAEHWGFPVKSIQRILDHETAQEIIREVKRAEAAKAKA